MNSIKILICVHQFFPSYSAGTEVLALSTARGLKKLGYDVKIVTCELVPEISCRSDSYFFSGFEVYRIWLNYDALDTGADKILLEYYNKDVAKEFALILAEFEPDVVHFFHLKNLTLSSLEECFKRDIVTVYTATDFWASCRSCQLHKPWGNANCSGPGEYAGKCMKHLFINNAQGSYKKLAKLVPSGIYPLVDRLVPKNIDRRADKFKLILFNLQSRQSAVNGALAGVDLIIAPTYEVKRSLTSIVNVPFDKLQYIKYAIEPPQMTSKRKEALVSTGKKQIVTFGYIGTLASHKGPHVILEALKEIPKIEGLKLVVYGDKKHYPDYFDHLSKISQVDSRVSFCGTFPPDKIGDILQSIDYLVIPSLWRENAPLVLLSALATGKKVIASDVAGITEYVEEGDNVKLFEPGDFRSLALAMKFAVNNFEYSKDLTLDGSLFKKYDNYLSSLCENYHGLASNKLRSES